MKGVFSTMHVKKLTQKIAASVAILALALPNLGFAQAATPAPSLEISGWIPYWRAAKGVASIIPHLNSFTEVNPFMYTVKQDGTLYAAAPLSDPEWVSLRTLAKQLNIRFVPAVMWANADAMDTVFRDPEKRKAHISSIIREVFGNGADGIDIDYESKYAKTAPYFALFLKELKEAIGYNKWVTCTIEARTPLDSRYSSSDSIPKDIAYANDFKSINQYCDSVRLMTYDQGRIDLKLNAAKGDPYVPVSDVDWVEKVVNLALQDIDKKKLVVGVPTYGYEYDMFPSLSGSGDMQYSQLWSFDPGYATDIASKLGLTPVRDSAGELMLSFPASKSPAPPIPLPNAIRVLSWSDAQAIKQKMDLAVRLGIRGIAIFKIDGGQDPALWDVLAQYQTMRAQPAEKVAKTTNAEADIAPILSSFNMPARDLKYGMISEDVRTLQKILNFLGFTVSSSGGGSPGKETTRFGPATQAALAAFQKSKKVTPASGYYGPKTRAAIKSL